jgi:hypothetical protein
MLSEILIEKSLGGENSLGDTCLDMRMLFI